MTDITERVHELYWNDDINCARTMLTCLSELFNVDIKPQTLCAAIGMHGAGGFRAQCGLVEGALMFIGIYMSGQGKAESEIANRCYRFADEFAKKFGSLSCFALRPNGFSVDDPPHACEDLTCVAVAFMFDFIKRI